MAYFSNNFQLLNSYASLVEVGKARPLVCPDCERNGVVQRYIVRIGGDGEPVLWCPTEGSFLTPGLDLYSQIRAVVMEHYV